MSGAERTLRQGPGNISFVRRGHTRCHTWCHVWCQARCHTQERNTVRERPVSRKESSPGAWNEMKDVIGEENKASEKGLRTDSASLVHHLVNESSWKQPEFSRARRSARRIPPGYEDFLENCPRNYYRLHNTPLNWKDAKATCEGEGAHLAIINSQAEAEIVRDLFLKYPDVGELIWLGFNDLEEEGKFVTVLGEPLSSTGYVKWSVYQPDNQNNEDCGSMWPSGELNDQCCHSWLPFVCELPL